MFKFENPEREGAESLKKAGYVEFDKFRPTVLGKVNAGREPIGYFCANCPFYQIKEDAVKGGFCNKLKGEVAAWGCCNFWEYKPIQAVQSQPQQPAQPEEPAEPAQQKPVANPIAKPAAKPVAKPAPAPARAPAPAKRAPAPVQESKLDILRKIIREELLKIKK